MLNKITWGILSHLVKVFWKLNFIARMIKTHSLRTKFQNIGPAYYVNYIIKEQKQFSSQTIFLL